MKKLFWVICLMMTIVSCEKELLMDNSENDGQTSLGISRLSVTTRAAGDDGQLQAVAQGRVYVFNAQDQCIEVLQTTAEEGMFATELPVGSYTLYAVGGDDLDRYILPSQEEATPTSVITCVENKQMDDLLLNKSDITLVKDVALNHNISLKRKVFCLNQVEIKNVPSEVTDVEVSLSPLYGGVTLEGKYPDANPKSCTVKLDNKGDGLWQSEPNTYLFPSKGEPTVTISFTTPDGTQSYSYSTNQTLEANHHVILSGTYEGNKGVSLTGILLSEKWGEDIIIPFGFDNPTVTPDPDPNPNPNPTDTPVPGQFYHDYYVVSVDAPSRKAVLLAKDNLAFTAPSGAGQTSWPGALNTAMSGLAKPTGFTCDDWRLPTFGEVKVFAIDSQVYALEEGASVRLFCTKQNGELESAWVQKKINTGAYDISESSALSQGVLLRPVITITY